MRNSSLPAVYPVLPGPPPLTRGNLTLPLLRRNLKGPSQFLIGHSMGHPLRQQIQGVKLPKYMPNPPTSAITSGVRTIVTSLAWPVTSPPRWPSSSRFTGVGPHAADRGILPKGVIFCHSGLLPVLQNPHLYSLKAPQDLSWGLRLHCLPQTTPRWIHPSPMSPPWGAFSACTLQWQLPPQPAASPQPTLPCLWLPDVRHWLFVRNICLPTRI